MIDMASDGKQRKKRIKRPGKASPRVIKKKRAFPTEVSIDGAKFKTTPDHLEPLKIPEEFVPVTHGMKWKCLKCGWCCSQNWTIDLTWKEYDRLKDSLPITEIALHEPTGASHPFFRIHGDCTAYDRKKKLCTIYDKKCYSCSAFPFLLCPPRELFICKLCKGVGEGSAIDVNETIDELITLKKEAGMNVEFYDTDDLPIL